MRGLRTQDKIMQIQSLCCETLMMQSLSTSPQSGIPLPDKSAVTCSALFVLIKSHGDWVKLWPADHGTFPSSKQIKWNIKRSLKVILLVRVKERSPVWDPKGPQSLGCQRHRQTMERVTQRVNSQFLWMVKRRPSSYSLLQSCSYKGLKETWRVKIQPNMSKVKFSRTKQIITFHGSSSVCFTKPEHFGWDNRSFMI